MKKLILIFLAALILLSFSGCTGAKQLSERLIIQGIGIDLDKEGYKLTLMYLDTESSTEEETVKILKVNGESVMDAMANSISHTGKEPLYSQNLFLLLGKTAAEKGFKDALAFFTTYYESRPNVNVFVSESTAEDIMMVKGMNPQQIDFISQSEKKSGRTVISNLMQMEADYINGNISPKTSMLSAVDNEIKTTGTAVFAKDRLLFTLSPEESLGALLISGKADTASELILEGSDKTSVDFTLTKCNSKIKTMRDGDRLIFTITITAQADIYIAPLKKEGVKSDLDKRVKELCENTVEKCMLNNSADIFGFSKRLLQNDSTYFKQLEDVSEVLTGASYRVSADVKIN